MLPIHQRTYMHWSLLLRAVFALALILPIHNVVGHSPPPCNFAQLTHRLLLLNNSDPADMRGWQSAQLHAHLDPCTALDNSVGSPIEIRAHNDPATKCDFTSLIGAVLAKNFPLPGLEECVRVANAQSLSGQ